MAGREVISKATIDQRVATITGMKPADVARVTRQFLAIVAEELVKLNGVYLYGFGLFHVMVRSGSRQSIVTLTFGNKKSQNLKPTRVKVDKKYYVGFRRSGALKDAFRARHQKPQEKSHGEVRSR